MDTGNSDDADQKKAARSTGKAKDSHDNNDSDKGEQSETAPSVTKEENGKRGNPKDDSNFSTEMQSEDGTAEATRAAVAETKNKGDGNVKDDDENEKSNRDSWIKKRTASARPANSTVGAVAVPGINAATSNNDDDGNNEQPIQLPQGAQIGVRTDTNDDDLTSKVAAASAKQDITKSGSEPKDVPEFETVDFPDDRIDATSDYAERRKSDEYNKKGAMTGGYAPPAAAAAAATAATAANEEPSVMNTNIDEPPFHPEPGAIPISQGPAMETNVDEPPFSGAPAIQEETAPNHEPDGAEATASRMQHQDLPLISARLVEDEEEQSIEEFHSDVEANNNSNVIIVEAKPLKREHICRSILRSRAALCGIATLLLVVAGLGIGLGVTLGTSSSSSPEKVLETTAPPTSSPTATPLSISEVRNVILDTFPYAASALSDDKPLSSPRRKALQWVYEDPSVSSYDEKRIVQRWILATYYYSMSGDSWKKNNGWLTTGKEEVLEWKNECLWFGLSCNETDDLSVGITSFNMDENRVNGTLPVELTWFNESLMFIQLKDNNVKGPIPTEYGQLSKLKRITTRINDMTGPIPTELGLLKDLEVLRVDQNKHKGKIPTELGLLDKLYLLNVRANNICGHMPQEICDLRTNKLDTLQADCKGSKVNCTCCTKCWEPKSPDCA